MSEPHPGTRPPPWPRRVGRALLRLLAFLVSLWGFGAIYYDGPFGKPVLNLILAILWVALTCFLTLRARTARDRLLWFAACYAVLLIPWWCIRPSNQRDWEPEWGRTPSATVDGDAVTIRNFRNFDSTGDGKTVERWETRTVRLSKLRGIDFFLNYWGSPLIAHPIFSFDFGPDGRVAFSIETRREKGEPYTTVGGLYKIYELCYVVADERDVIRVRTNVRKGEDVYLFRLAVKPEKARERFMEYIGTINSLAERPQFYNVLTANCTTSVRNHIAPQDRKPLDWRLIANGKMDELMAERGIFQVKDLPLAELKRRGHINPAAREAGDAPDFSDRIRRGVPGF